MSRSRTIVPIEVGHGIATAPLPTLVLVFVIQTDPVVDRSAHSVCQHGLRFTTINDNYDNLKG